MAEFQIRSPFLDLGLHSQADSLAVLHLKRDLQIPTLLREEDDNNEGYDEGKVTNTRFGSFPHSTLIGLPWGSQVRASAVDTGSRGRKGGSAKLFQGQKRKRAVDTPEGSTPFGSPIEEPQTVARVAKVASSGFAHILPPTPESWTTSLPHRTQVVYTPDYSYILQRLRVRPGSTIIEAGAGSGSFTHAAARAVFNGYPDEHEAIDVENAGPLIGRGKVWSFEFHEQRAEKLKVELRDHGLDGIVELTHRDVYEDGFVASAESKSVIAADAIFLDLPAPWIALKHLTRRPDFIKVEDTNSSALNSTPMPSQSEKSTPCSPLNPRSTVRICTFSPCIEQVQRTVSTLQQLGWLEIEMVEIAAKRIEVRRERVGLQEEGLRGVNASPASVDEAVARLRGIEARARTFHTESKGEDTDMATETGTSIPNTFVSKQQRLAGIRDAQAGRKIFKEGRLVHRSEPELKTHTSYLVFAILPREWTMEDEERARQAWPSRINVQPSNTKKLSKKQMKKAARAKAGEVADGASQGSANEAHEAEEGTDEKDVILKEALDVQDQGFAKPS